MSQRAGGRRLHALRFPVGVMYFLGVLGIRRTAYMSMHGGSTGVCEVRGRWQRSRSTWEVELPAPLNCDVIGHMTR